MSENNNQYSVSDMFGLSIQKLPVKETLVTAYQSLKEKGFLPVQQLVGYLMTGDSQYITVHMDARKLMIKHDRDEYLEEMVRAYLESEKEREPGDVLKLAYDSAISQKLSPDDAVECIVAYLYTGDPTYLSSRNGTRSAAVEFGRDETMVQLLEDYLE